MFAFEHLVFEDAFEEPVVDILLKGKPAAIQSLHVVEQRAGHVDAVPVVGSAAVVASGRTVAGAVEFGEIAVDDRFEASIEALREGGVAAEDYEEK